MSAAVVYGFFADSIISSYDHFNADLSSSTLQ
jgi:hypothetical protein